MTTNAINRIDVLGVGISLVDVDLAIAEVGRWIRDGEQHYVCVTGVHGVMESQDHADLMTIHNRSGLTVADGMPMFWAGRYVGARRLGRVRGPDLLPAMCRMATDNRWTSYFYGGAPGTAEALVERLVEQFPGFRVAGWHCPPFRELTMEEDVAVVAEINACAPDLIWVGLSTPKQERWMADHVGRVKASALLGVGAAFDVHAGLIRQAPPWIQNSGFEWLFRIFCDPRRLWRRYLYNNPRFVVRILRRRPFLRTG